MTDPKSLAPFSCSYSANVPELLSKLGCSLAISTYQAGKVIFLSPKNEDQLIQLPRTFSKPMGIAMLDEPDKMAVACKDEVIVFANSKELAVSYPKNKNTYDALYMPRCTYHIGQLDIHDLSWGTDGLYAVNTLFSCIIKIDDDYNFTPVWIPPFVSGLSSEDKCHLNGMVMVNGKPKYATAFNRGNTYQSWREGVTTDGVLMDLESNEIVAANLRMPHSPRVFNDNLYLLFSATGEIVKVDPSNGSVETIARIDGFIRGMAFYKDFLFVGLSKLR
ncbi:MAG: TIGR03032 family protein, partial [Bacteroidales bacterium]|nr:TIGR03032 family protein [Bacteroidales bacterium]